MACRWLALALLLAPQLQADVLVVDGGGGGDFTYPQGAISAAAEGDTVLIHAGQYSDFYIGAKSLNVVAEPKGSVTVAGILIEDLGSAQRVVLSGLTVVAPDFGLSEYHALDVIDCQGAVRVQDCSFTGAVGSYFSPGAQGHAAVAVRSSGDVALVRCDLLGGKGLGGEGALSWETCPADFEHYQGGPALRMEHANVALHQCTLVGGTGGNGVACGVSGSGGPGIRALASSAFLAGCDVAGGTGGFVDPCECLGDGGNALELDGALLDLLGTALSPGLPSPGSAGGVVGQLQILAGGAVVAALPGGARGLVAPGALTAGDALQIDVEGEVGDAAFLAASIKPGMFNFAGITGPLLLTPPFFVAGAPLGTIGAGGQVSASFATPALPVGVEDATIFLQALAVDSGGGLVLTGARTVILITSSILP